MKNFNVDCNCQIYLANQRIKVHCHSQIIFTKMLPEPVINDFSDSADHFTLF